MKNALIFITDRNGVPNMLKKILFKPVLKWNIEALVKSGVEYFYLFCEEAFCRETENCISGLEKLQIKIGTSFTDANMFFEEGETAVIAGAVLLTEEGIKNIPDDASDSAVYKTCDHCFKEIGSCSYLPEGMVGIWNVYDDIKRHEVQDVLRRQIVKRYIERGVSFIDPGSAFIMPEVEIGKGTVILPGVIIKGYSKIGENCEIGPNSVINSCTVGNGSVINASQINDSIIGENTKVGPFAYIRPNCDIGSDIKIGDFVEVKNSVIGDGTKISHLTYVGDSDIGENVNLGCGTVTVNYDGTKKFRTRVEDNVFVGCNTNLVAPVTVHSNAYVAAGSTITEDVPASTLAIARERQIIKENWKK